MENRINIRLDIQSSLSFIVFSVVIVGTGFFLVAQIKNTANELDRLASSPQYQMLREEMDDEAASNSDNTSGEWKLYRNKGSGYVFQYPAKYSVTVDREGYVTLRDPQSDSQGFSFSSLRTRGNLTLGQFIHNDTSYDTDEVLKEQYRNERTVAINGITTYKFFKSFSTRSDRYYFFLKDKNSGVEASYTYFSANFPGEPGVNPFAKEYDQIISTFKFVK